MFTQNRSQIKILIQASDISTHMIFIPNQLFGVKEKYEKHAHVSLYSNHVYT